MAKVAVVGSTNMDITIRTPRLPAVGETVIGGEWLVSPGGKGANQAVAASRAAADVVFVSAVGDDQFGQRALENLRGNGVGISHVHMLRDAQTGVAVIMVDDEGRNIIAVSSGANAHITPGHVDAAGGAIGSADVLLLQLEIPVETVSRAAEMAHAAGVPVVLNPAPAPQTELPSEVLSRVDVLIVNEVEAAQVAGPGAVADHPEAARILFERGVGSVIVTLGQRGCRIETHDGARHIDPHKVRAVDTVGAGDAFCGAFACALAQGRALASAAAFANAAAALATTAVGAQSSIPRRAQIEEALASAGGSPNRLGYGAGHPPR